MSLADRIDALRRQFEDCNAVTVADLSTGMALYSSTKTKLPQEQMDQLCDTALHLLIGAIPALLRQDLQTAIIVDGSAVELFLRGSAPGSEVLCCNCSIGIDPAAFATAATRLLTDIAGAT